MHKVIGRLAVPSRLYGIILIICSSRGLLELFLAKSTAYVIQLFSLVIAVVLCWRSVQSVHKQEAQVYFLLTLFAALSIMASTAVQKVSLLAGISVTAVNLLNLLFLVAAIEILKNEDRLDIDGQSLSFNVRLVSLWVMGFAFAQYLGFVNFPGAYGFLDSARLSGSLGSMQHLSLVLAILSVLSLALLMTKFSVIDAANSIALISTLMICFTRIGYLVFGLTISLYVLFAIVSGKTSVVLKVAIPSIFFLIVVGLVGMIMFPELSEIVIKRIATIDFSEASNQERVQHWAAGLSAYTSTPLLVSDSTGLASQIPKSLLGEPSYHYESGHLQYLVNFGLGFWLLVVYLFVKWFRLLAYRDLTKFLPVSLLVALFIYMFNEVVPVYVIFPLVSIVALYSKQSRGIDPGGARA